MELHHLHIVVLWKCEPRKHKQQVILAEIYEAVLENPRNNEKNLLPARSAATRVLPSLQGALPCRLGRTLLGSITNIVTIGPEQFNGICSPLFCSRFISCLIY